MRELPLGILDTDEIDEVVTETGDVFFHVDTEMSGHLHMVGVKDPFDNGKRPLNEGAGSADRTISPLIFL